MCRKFTGEHSSDKILYINSRNNIHQKEKLTQANSCEFFRDLCINNVPRCLIFQQGTCNDLNKNGHHRPLQSNTVRRYGIVGVSVAPWEEVCQWGGIWGFKSSSHAQYHSLFLMPANLDVECPVTSPAPCLSTCNYASHHDNNRLNLWNRKPAPMKCFTLQ